MKSVLQNEIYVFYLNPSSMSNVHGMGTNHMSAVRGGSAEENGG